LDLNEGEANVVERVSHRAGVLAESVAEAVDEAGDRIDGECRLRQIGRGRREVDRGEFVETHDVVGDYDLGGHIGEAAARFLHRPLGVLQCVELLGIEFGGIEDVAIDGVGAIGIGVEGLLRGFVGHVRYPTDGYN
jgi:hypothetical protein